MASGAVSQDRIIGRRAAHRTPISLMVEFKGGSQSWSRAMLADLSVTGFRLTGLRQPIDSGSLWMRPHGMQPLPAKVRWTTGMEVGCEFLYPLDRVMEEAIRQLSAEGAMREPIRLLA